MTQDPAPPDDSWVAAIHGSAVDDAPLGAGVVIDERRVLTSEHVAREPEGTALWVAFPRAEDAYGPRCRVAAVRVAREVRADLAVLELEEPVPAGVRPAPLLRPKSALLRGRRWWAFGFPDRDPDGNCADGVVGTSLGGGRVRLDAESRYHVQPGFSGGGLWSPDYGAVVGIVGQANDRGDGRAITLHQANQCLPEEQLHRLTEWSAETAGEAALSAWGWTLATDDEGRRHWRPRARGVSVDSERGYRFQGRRAALSEIVAWLDRAHPDRRVLVVTGSPGVGKSAVLGRIVTTADADVAAALPVDDDAVRARLGAVACAVHAKGKTALEVAAEIARAASAALPERLEDFPAGLRDALTERGGQRFNVVIDALDEATDPRQARAIVADVVGPIAQTCADVGAQVVVGTRRRDDAGDLLRPFGPGRVQIDLDTPEYFSIADLSAYALATLQLRGDERADSPYADDATAAPVAARIAALAERIFLVAGLIARDHGLHDETALDPDEVSFTATVEAALGRYLERLAGVDGVTAAEALTALAFAEAPGLTPELWQAAVQALHGLAVPAGRLVRFARGSAANFLVESAGDDTGSTHRLFHQALADALVSARADLVSAVDDERSLTRALLAYGAGLGWDHAPDYLRRSLPGHALRAGLIDALLADDEYLLHADLQRLIPAAHKATTPAGRRRARLLRLTPRAIAAAPTERAAMFNVTEALEGLGSAYRDRRSPLPYRARWAVATPRAERAVLEGHTGGVWAVCPIEVGGQTLLATAGEDGTVGLWDPACGQQQVVLTGHTRWVNAVCAVAVDGRALLATAGADTTVRLWDPASGQQQTVLTGHTGSVYAVCAVTVDGRALLASASDDATVRLWDPASGQQQTVLTGHNGSVYAVYAVCAVTVDSRALLATAGHDQTVRLWDPASGQQQTVLTGHADLVRGVCAVTVDGRALLATAGYDQTVRLWDPASGQQRTVLTGHTGRVLAVCAVQAGGRALLASAGADATVRLWDPASGAQEAALTGHSGWVWAVWPVEAGGRALLASAGDDGTVRLWDPASGAQRAALTGHDGRVWAVCAVQAGGRALLASAGDDGTVRLWDPASGAQRAALTGHSGWVLAVCAVQAGGRALLASAGADRAVRIWDPASGECRLVVPVHHAARALAWLHDHRLLVVGLTAGLLALTLPD